MRQWKWHAAYDICFHLKEEMLMIFRALFLQDPPNRTKLCRGNSMIHSVLQAADFSHLHLASRCTSLMSIRLYRNLMGRKGSMISTVIVLLMDRRSWNMLKLLTWKDNLLYISKDLRPCWHWKRSRRSPSAQPHPASPWKVLGVSARIRTSQAVQKIWIHHTLPQNSNHQLRSSMLVLEEIEMLHSMNCDVATLRPRFSMRLDIHLLQGALWQELNLKHDLRIQSLSQ